MAIDTTRTVREFVLELPSSTNVFEQLGIDYCCGGQKPLAEACAAAGTKLNEVAATLERLGEGPPKLVIAQHSVRMKLAESYGGLGLMRVVKQGDNALSFYGGQ